MKESLSDPLASLWNSSDNQYTVSDADGLGWYTVKVIANRNRAKNLLDSEIFCFSKFFNYLPLSFCSIF